MKASFNMNAANNAELNVTFTDSSTAQTGKVVASNNPAVKVSTSTIGSGEVILEKGSYTGTTGLQLISKTSKATVCDGVSITATNSFYYPIDINNGGVLVLKNAVLTGVGQSIRYSGMYSTDVIDLSQHPNPEGLTIYTGRKMDVSRVQLPTGYGLYDDQDTLCTGNEVPKNKTVTVKLIRPVYTVSLSNDGNGTATASVTSGRQGTQVTLTATPNAGYQFKEWQVISGGVTVTNNQFTISTENVEIKAVYELIPAAYTITFDANGGSGDAFADGASLTASTNRTLYAQWKAVPAVNPLTIARQPVDQAVTEGQRAEFSVEATGDGLTYQWYINRNDGSGWRKLDGAVGNAYTTAAVQMDCDGYLYRCLVTDQYGVVRQSDAAALRVSAIAALPQTGDSSAPLLWLAMCMVSMTGILLVRKKACGR